jgi:hypothetical protein
MESGCLMLSTRTYLIGTFNTLEGFVVGKDYLLDLKPFLPPSLFNASVHAFCLTFTVLTEYEV